MHQIPDMLDQAQAAKEGVGMVVLPCFFADAMTKQKAQITATLE